MIFPSAWCLSLEDKAPPDAVTFFNPAFPNGAGLLPRARLLHAGQMRLMSWARLVGSKGTTAALAGLAHWCSAAGH
jgi:hypothetical protein